MCHLGHMFMRDPGAKGNLSAETVSGMLNALFLVQAPLGRDLADRYGVKEDL